MYSFCITETSYTLGTSSPPNPLLHLVSGNCVPLSVNVWHLSARLEHQRVGVSETHSSPNLPPCENPQPWDSRDGLRGRTVRCYGLYRSCLGREEGWRHSNLICLLSSTTLLLGTSGGLSRGDAATSGANLVSPLTELLGEEGQT